MTRLLLVTLASLALAPSAWAKTPPPTPPTLTPPPPPLRPPQVVPAAPQKGWLGVTLEPATPDEQRELGVTRPVPRVAMVFPNSPAQKIGVQVGDYILSIDGVNVMSMQDMINRVSTKAPGTVAALMVQRALNAPPEKLLAVLDLRLEGRDLLKSNWVGKPLPGSTLISAQKDGSVAIGGPATQGKIVLLDYFATWCGPCRAVMPALERLQATYGKDGLMVVGVSSETVEVMRGFLTRTPLKYTVAVEPTGALQRTLMVSALPTLFFVSKDGTVRDVLLGSGHDRELENLVRNELGLAPLPPPAPPPPPAAPPAPPPVR